MKKKRRNKKWKIILAASGGVLAALFLAAAVYVGDYSRADDTAMDALLSEGEVKVDWMQDDVVAFLPREADAGLIFYPGGKVEFTAYAPLLHALAEEGVLCVLVKMPCNLAVFDRDAAAGLAEKFPEVGEWYIGGHSLGGAMAAGYAAEHADEYKGLILLAAYSTEDISQSGLKVLSVYGSEDGVLNREKYTENWKNLPADVKEYVIEGGCHAQFGSYGKQEGDGTPEIDGEEQRKITVRYIMEFAFDIPWD